MAPSTPSGHRGRLLSQQVSGGRYFFLKLVPPRAANFALVFGGCEKCHPDYVVSRPAFAYYGLEYVAEGAGWVHLDAEEVGLESGAVFAYAPETNCEIRTDPSRPMVKYFLCLAGKGVATRLKQAGVAPNQVRMLTAHAEVRNVFEDLIRECRHHRRLTTKLCAALTEVLLLKIKDLSGRSGRSGNVSEELFCRSTALIEARLGELTTLNEIAAAVGIRPSSVCRLFRRFHGISPYQYLLRRKMTLAAELLIETAASVKEVAQRVGFADPYHFSRCFKGVHGVSPSHLREYRSTSA
jgi:AraC family transcriptional regulator